MRSESGMFGVVVSNEVGTYIELELGVEEGVTEFGSVEEHADVALFGEGAQFFADLGRDWSLGFLLTLLKRGLGLLLFGLHFLLQAQAGGLLFFQGFGIGDRVGAEVVNFTGERAEFFVQQGQLALRGTEFEFEGFRDAHQLFNARGLIEKLAAADVGYAGRFDGLDHRSGLGLGRK